MKINLNRCCWAFLIVFSMPALFILIGCESANIDSSSTENKLPKLDFHRPKDLTKAIDRLTEINKVLVTSEKLPAASKFEVVEVIHGEGVGQHSHFYSADEVSWDEAESVASAADGHSQLKSEKKKHTIEVDIFTELKDIVQWLPEIAADTDLSEQDWNLVNDVATQLGEHLNGIFATNDSVEKRRDSYQSQADKVMSQLNKIATLTPSSNNGE